MTYALTAEQRRVTCVHEAAHAVVYALGGEFVYRVAVAPVGSTDWTVEGRKGGTPSELRGVCQASDLGPLVTRFLRYAPGEYGADRAGFRRDLAQMSEAMREHVRPEAVRRETYRQIRAHVCGGGSGCRHAPGARARPLGAGLAARGRASIPTTPTLKCEAPRARGALLEQLHSLTSTHMIIPSSVEPCPDLVFLLARPTPCLGCEKLLRREAEGVIIHRPTGRMRPVCPRCSLRARESGIFFEQLARCLGLGRGFSRPQLRRLLGKREMPTTLAGWDAFEAGVAATGGVR